MDVLRKLGKALGGFLFTTFLVSAISMITIAQFTEYDNLKSTISPFLEDMLKREIDIMQINQTYSALLFACQNREKIELPLGEENLTLNCEEIRTIKPENLTSLIAVTAFDKIYFKHYDCEFIECLRRGENAMLILFSSKANEFFKDMQNLLWIGTAIGAMILFVSVETWQGRLKAFGISCLFTALPFFLISYIKNLVLSQFTLPEALALASPIIDKILSSISNNFLFILIAGIALTSSGYLLEYFLKKKKG